MSNGTMMYKNYPVQINLRQVYLSKVHLKRNPDVSMTNSRCNNFCQGEQNQNNSVLKVENTSA